MRVALGASGLFLANEIRQLRPSLPAGPTTLPREDATHKRVRAASSGTVRKVWESRGACEDWEITTRSTNAWATRTNYKIRRDHGKSYAELTPTLPACSFSGRERATSSAVQREGAEGRR